MIVSGLYFNHITFLLLLLYTNQPRRDIDLAGQAAYGRRGKEIFDTDLYLQLAVDTFQDRHGFKRIPPARNQRRIAISGTLRFRPG